MPDIHFNNLRSLHWLWLVVALAVLIVIAFKLRRRSLQRFADSSLIDRLTPQRSFARQYTRAGLMLSSMICLVAALLDPRWGVSYETVEQRGIDIIFALDVSRSMQAEDVRPNRLERAKQMIGDIVEQLGGDRVGLITIAGVPALKCPLTSDYSAFTLSLQEVQSESGARGGSLIGDALRKAADSFTDEIPDYKAVILFSDGEDHGSYPIEIAARLYEEHGVRVYTVGIGDASQGARIPIVVDGRRGYLTFQGEQVWSKMDPTLLREVALIGGGAFIPAGDRQVDMAAIFNERISPATNRRFETTRIQVYRVQYQWFAGAALLLLLIETLMTDRKSIREQPAGRWEMT